jgi:hypothetical protein
MSLWFWIPFVAFELIHIFITVFLVLAIGGLGQQHAKLKNSFFVLAKASDENFTSIGQHVGNMAQFLVQQFHLDKQETVAPKKVTPPDWKN